MQPISGASETELKFSLQLEGGKVIEVVPEGQTSLFKVQFSSGGELPSSLRGRYTNLSHAVRDVRLYADQYKPRKRKADTE
jgi:hypothetical protein